MSFRTKDLAEFQLKVEGTDMMIGADMLRDVSVIQNVHSPVPTVTLTFLDNKRAAASAGVFVDGAKLQVTIGDGKKDPHVYEMRQWSLEDGAANTAGDICTLSGTADVVPWFRKVVSKAYKGTSTDVAKKIAKENGIQKVEADSANDEMVHLPDGSTVSQFVRRIIDHSWVAEGASLFQALTYSGDEMMLRIKDIMKQEDSASKRLVSAGMAAMGDFTVWDYRISSHTGFLNAVTNYGHKAVQEQLGSNAPDVFTSMAISKLSSALGINSEVQKAVNLVRTLYHPPDVGNTHKDWVKAAHHNVKSRAAFSSIVSLMTDELTDYKLLDTAEAKLARSSGEPDAAFSGKYRVSAIARHISKGSYREKLVLTGQGTNADLFGQGV